MAAIKNRENDASDPNSVFSVTSVGYVQGYVRYVWAALRLGSTYSSLPFLRWHCFLACVFIVLFLFIKMFHLKPSSLMRLSSSLGKMLCPNKLPVPAGKSRSFSLYPVDDVMSGADPGKLQGEGHESKWCPYLYPKLKTQRISAT